MIAARSPRSPRQHRSSRSARPWSVIVVTILLANPLYARGQATSPGKVVEAPANIANFAPTERFDGATSIGASLRNTLESLSPEARLWYQHVQTLADPYFGGRVPGTRGSELATNYIAWYFESYGLLPAFPDTDDQDSGPGSYFQAFAFSVSGGPTRATVSNPHLSIDGHELDYEKEFVIFGNSGSGKITAPVTFVGYAIESGVDDYSSFDEDTDLSGRIALMLRYEPLDEDGDSRWSDDGLSRHASIRRKLITLANRGAAGIIVVTPPGATVARKGLDSLKRSSQFGKQLTIPIAQIEPAIADDLLIQADKKTRDLMTLRRLADKGRITTVDLSDEYEITIGAEVKRATKNRKVNARNVGAVLPGRGELASQWLIIGGHHDHVGIGELRGVQSGHRGELHPGADDNASGTAGVLVLAKKLSESYAAAQADADLRSILFLTFDAEEQGLYGSKYYAAHPTMAPVAMTTMINMDMIGRLRSESLLVMGTQTGTGLEELLIPHFKASGMTVAIAPRGSGRSDDANFHKIKVPAIHFFTGMHKDYHAPGDAPHRVNPAGADRVIDLMYKIILDLTTMQERMEFRERE